MLEDNLTGERSNFLSILHEINFARNGRELKYKMESACQNDS